jgi:hydroxymethylpyrimidine kinase/phosphomethylpyrimidine kinase/thiamine-phosphate diphosphorylase
VSGAAKPVVLAIGGSDCSGMAGTAMDLRVIRALGGHGAAAVTAVTAQHGGAVTAVNPVAPAVLHQQLGACRALPIGAVKIGLVATPEQVRVCGDFLRATGLPSVLDPVMASSAGSALMAAGTIAALRRELLPLCTIATPNHGEAERLAGRPVAGDRDAASAGEALRALGAPGLLVKGGHGTGPASCDLYLAGGQRFWLHSPRLPTPHSRGTGCALASAIATALALGHPLADAVVIAKMAINQGLRQGRGWDDHPGPVDISHFPDDGVDLPMLLDRLDEGLRETPFPGCGALPLGLYPVVDRAHWLATLLPAGVTTIQLRIKDLDGAALRAELGDGIALARRHGARLFINDHWQLAIELGAYGVHLGQEDLATADLGAIHRAGLRLGISTHGHVEVARAHRCRPSYLASGPVYPTTSKIMPWAPQGPRGLAYWRRVLSDYPLVAIGGINRDRLIPVRDAGADGVAMISALTGAADPAATARDFVRRLAMRPRRHGT